MIGSVFADINGKRKELRFSTRAMARVERSLGQSIPVILQDLGGQYGIDAACEIISASMNNGRGADLGIAYDAVDVMGQEAAFGIVNDLVLAAYPDAAAEADEGDAPEKPKG